MKLDSLTLATINYVLHPKPIADLDEARFIVRSLLWLRGKIDTAINKARK